MQTPEELEDASIVLWQKKRELQSELLVNLKEQIKIEVLRSFTDYSTVHSLSEEILKLNEKGIR